jgi:hypothetical protein
MSAVPADDRRNRHPLRRALLLALVLFCGCGLTSHADRHAIDLDLRAVRRVACCPPVVSRTSISYVNSQAMRGYQENENDGTANSLWREYRLYLRERRPGWSVLDSTLAAGLHGRLAGCTDTLRGLDSATWALLGREALDYCVAVYDVRLMHAQSVYAGRYGGLGYGASIRRSLFLRYAVLDIKERKIAAYGEQTTSASDGKLGLMAKAVGQLFGQLTP